MRKLILVGMVLLALAGIGAASAATNLVKNGGFEDPILGDSVGYVECPNGLVNDWVIGEAGIDHILKYWSPPEGEQSIDLSRHAQGSVSQLIPTEPGKSYDLSFAMAGNPDGAPKVKTVEVFWNGVSRGTDTFDTTGKSVDAMGWVTKGRTGLPASSTGLTTELKFVDVSESGTYYGVALDTIIVTPAALIPVPEFPTLALPLGMVISILGAVYYIRSTREQ
jgi:choice-of-anchor C domain-containing protein